MNWYQVFAKGHHGYPQPEDSFEENLYESYCPHCGIHEAQSNPVRVKSESKAPNSNFIQLNWIYDLFLVRPEVESLIRTEGFNSISFLPVINHRTNTESSFLRQLCISSHIASAEISRLQKVSCVPNNEESKIGKSEPSIALKNTKYCGLIKSHPPTSLSISSASLEGAPDIFQTQEWFGSGGSAFRLTICSERFLELVELNKLRGLGFKQVRLNEYSERVT